LFVAFSDGEQQLTTSFSVALPHYKLLPPWLTTAVAVYVRQQA